MRDRREKIRNGTFCSVLLGVSLVISLVESACGINALLPLPGVKMGFCNIATTACFYAVSRSGALAISILRPAFLFVISGNPVSFAMSLVGSLFALLSLVLTRPLYKRLYSFCGISCISAVFHSIGQTLAAMLIMKDDALLLYLPLFAAASSIVGTLCGIVMNLILPRLCAVYGKKEI